MQTPPSPHQARRCACAQHQGNCNTNSPQRESPTHRAPHRNVQTLPAPHNTKNTGTPRGSRNSSWNKIRFWMTKEHRQILMTDKSKIQSDQFEVHAVGRTESPRLPKTQHAKKTNSLFHFTPSHSCMCKFHACKKNYNEVVPVLDRIQCTQCWNDLPLQSAHSPSRSQQ